MSSNSPPHVDVVAGNGDTFHVCGRVAKMILWLCHQAQAIEAMHRGELIVRFRDGNLSGRIAEDWDTLAY